METLIHYGIQGQKWGTRRWQYADGRFNEEGKERYFGKSRYLARPTNTVGKAFSYLTNPLGIANLSGKQKEAYYEKIDKKDKKGRDVYRASVATAVAAGLSLGAATALSTYIYDALNPDIYGVNGFQTFTKAMTAGVIGTGVMYGIEKTGLTDVTIEDVTNRKESNSVINRGKSVLDDVSVGYKELVNFPATAIVDGLSKVTRSHEGIAAIEEKEKQMKRQLKEKRQEVKQLQKDIKKVWNE